MNRRARIRALVVDDDYALRDLVASTLRSHGYDVTLAPTGRIGVEHLRSAPDKFRFIVMDHHMPDMDGLSACRIMQNCAPGTPIIMMSSDELHAEVEGAGACAFLHKPFAPGELLDCIDRHVESAD